jgi:hypothetical protein
MFLSGKPGFDGFQCFSQLNLMIPWNKKEDNTNTLSSSSEELIAVAADGC